MSTLGINTSFNSLQQVIKKLTEMESVALATAVDNISSDNFNDLDTDLVRITDCKLQLEYALKTKWAELHGDQLSLAIDRSDTRLFQLEQYFKHSPEEDHFELKPALFSVTNELFDLKRKLHVLENSAVDFELPEDAVTLLLRLKFI